MIKENGCHLVPKASLPNSSCTDEWRLSFSSAEIILSEQLSDFQKKCYLVVKTIFYINFKELIDERTVRYLPSYAIKTIKFKLQDDIHQNEWQSLEDQLDYFSVIQMYYDILSDSLNEGFLSCYFVEEMNILSGFSKEFLIQASAVAERISKNPLDYTECWDLAAICRLSNGMNQEFALRCKESLRILFERDPDLFT